MVLWRRRSRQRGEKSAKTRDSRFTNALAMPKRKGSSTSRPRARNKVAAKEEREARVVENAQRLDKLPQEVWEKILDELKENDLFPLALSCRYFRQKQKDLVARTRQHEVERRKPRLALKTTLHSKPVEGQPASADYLRFCSKEHVGQVRGKYVYGITYTDKHRDSYVCRLWSSRTCRRRRHRTEAMAVDGVFTKAKCT